MLKDLERYFTQKGWYSGQHSFLNFTLEGGFEAFSGRASETWEYRWVVQVIGYEDIDLPSIRMVGKVYESLDNVCDNVLKKLLEHDKNRNANNQS